MNQISIALETFDPLNYQDDLYNEDTQQVLDDNQSSQKGSVTDKHFECDLISNVDKYYLIPPIREISTGCPDDYQFNTSVAEVNICHQKQVSKTRNQVEQVLKKILRAFRLDIRD